MVGYISRPDNLEETLDSYEVKEIEEVQEVMEKCTFKDPKICEICGKGCRNRICSVCKNKRDKRICKVCNKVSVRSKTEDTCSQCKVKAIKNPLCECGKRLYSHYIEIGKCKQCS